MSRRLRPVRWAVIAACTALALVLGISAVRAWENLVEIRHATALSHLDTLKVDFRLTPDTFAISAPSGDFAVARSGTVFLATPKGPMGIDGQDLVRPLRAEPVSSLAIGEDDAMLTVARGYFGVLDSRGEPLEAVPLPFDDFHVAGSSRPGVAYLYGGHADDWRLYRFRTDGSYQLLAQSELPIVGVAERGSELLVATPKHVARLTGNGLQVAFRAPDEWRLEPISSIAASPDGLLFVATPRRILGGAGGGFVPIVNDSGGQLRWRDGKLYVSDPRRRILYALSPADHSMFQPGRP